MRTNCVCTGCTAIIPADSIDEHGLCFDCAYRYGEAQHAGHDDDCECADCCFVAAVGVEKMRRLAPEYAGPSGLPRYVREALTRKATRPAPYAPRCAAGECDCGCDYLGADAL